MKKTSLFLIAVSILLAFSCKEKNNEKNKNTNQAETYSEEVSLEYEDYSFIDPEDFFKLDYRPEKPEPKSVSRKASTLAPVADKTETTSVIPGLRVLGEYKTSYTKKAGNLKSFLETLASTKSAASKEQEQVAESEGKLTEEQIKKELSKGKNSSASRAKSVEELARENETGPFQITSWGPGTRVPAEMKNVQFYVEFTYPIASIQALKDGADIQKEAEKILQINPKPKGKYIWYGTKMLAYETDEPLIPYERYTMSVGNVKSLGGKVLTGEKSFTACQELPELRRVEIGKKDKNTYYYYDADSGVPVANAKYSKIYFKGYVNKDYAQKAFKLSFTSKENKTTPVAFKLTPVFDKGEWANFTEDLQFTDSYYLVITDNSLKNEGRLIFESASNASDYSGSSPATYTFETLKPFTLKQSYNGTRWDDEAYAFTFEFTHEIDPASTKGNIKCDGVEIPESKIRVSSNCLTIINPPIEPSKQGLISVSKNLQSVYKVSLDEEYSVYILGRNKNGYVRFLDSGTKMLEAQFPHKLVFEYRNISKDSAYKLSKSDNPLYQPGWNERWERDEYGATVIPGRDLNKTYFEEIDLDPLLTDGKGWVKFEADIGTLQYGSEGTRENSESNFLNLQVTNLAATARIGINRSVIMVRSLDKNEPVKGADVCLENLENPNIFSKTVKTDENGLAIIQGKDSYRKLFSNYSLASKTVISVHYNGDKIKFKPTGHYPWQYSVTSDDISNALKEKPRTFMFTDRGIYKPGETVTFRGIDRNQNLGSYVSYQGNYTITFEQNSWRSQNVYGRLYGKTAESGGFWGSFDIPEDLEPGNYSIVYSRDDRTQTERLYFTVKYFEKRKTQGEIVNTQGELYEGDTISSTVKASYLAGGYLAGEKYECSWYSQNSYFSPEDSKLSAYEFNPASRYDYDYEGSRFVNSSSGFLSERGEAVVKCSTEGDSKGYCKIWRLETDITDESNERLTLVSTKTVHPALYYTGIGPAEGLRGFAKTGKELTFPIILVTPEEKVLTDKSLVNSSLEYTFTRHYWSYDYQNSVDNSIYKRYTEHHDVENQGSVKADSGTSVKFTPKNAGYYTLRVSSKDKNGRLSVSERSFYVTGSNASFYFNDNDTAIKLTPDKNLYTPGETAHILLESPLPKGDYLVTTEREGIFTEEIRHLEENTAVLDIKVARNFVPVFYVSVSSYSVRNGKPTHNWGEKDMDKPKGFYGVTSVLVDPQVRAFSIDVETDKEKYKPGETATITLKATKGGKPLEGAELTIMAVDRAVIDVINYHVPNPIDEFYSQYNFPLSVTGGDSRFYLMDPVTYSVKNLQGGDSDEEKDDEERKDFRPTAFFVPCEKTDAEGKVTISYKLPDSLTTYRLTTFGVKGELLALQEDEFVVQNPVNVQAVQPQVLRERDTAECGVVLTNISEETQTVQVSAEIREPKKASTEAETSGLSLEKGTAFIDGKTEHTVKIGKGDSSVVYFDIAAVKKGDIEIVYRIKSDVLNEKLVSRVKIEKTYCKETVSLSGSTGKTEKKEISQVEGIAFPSFAEDNEGSLSVTLDATRLGLLSKAVNYVFEYPYGCLEQQSSKILPLVIFDKYIKVFGMESDVSNTKKCVKTHFKQWKKSQLENGGFPYWPENKQYASFYVSLRIAHIYALALQNGYSKGDLYIDIDALKNYIISEAKNRNLSTDTKAYAYYVSSLLDFWKEMSFLSTDLDLNYEQSLTASAYLGLAYYNTKDAENIFKADDIYKYIKAYMRPMLRSVDIQQPFTSNGFWAWEFTDIIQKAAILQFFETRDPEDSMNERLIFSLISDMQGGYWRSTANTAAALEAFKTVIQKQNLSQTDLTGKVFLDEKELLSGDFKGAGAEPVTRTFTFDSEDLKNITKDKVLPLRFSGKGYGNLYYNASLTYAIPEELQEKRDMGFDVSFTLTDSESSKEVKPNASGIYELESSKMYKYKVTVKNVKSRTLTAIRIPVPSGTQIIDPELQESSAYGITISSSRGCWWSNKVILPNEFRVFYDELQDGSVTIEFYVRAARRGVYPVPPVMAECMYESELFGRSQGYLCTIR